MTSDGFFVCSGDNRDRPVPPCIHYIVVICIQNLLKAHFNWYRFSVEAQLPLDSGVCWKTSRKRSQPVSHYSSNNYNNQLSLK